MARSRSIFSCLLGHALFKLRSSGFKSLTFASHRTKFVNLVSKALIEPSASDPAKLVLNHAYSLLTGNI